MSTRPAGRRWEVRMARTTEEPRPAGRRPLAQPPEVAKYLAVPEHTLANWRSAGIGPQWSKVGRHPRYRWADVEKWIDAQATSTGAGDS